MLSYFWKSIVVALIVLGSKTNANSNSGYSVLGQKVDSALKVFERQGFCGSILIKSHASVILRCGYGYSDCDRKTRTSPDCVYDIGSVTKVLTATAILKLAEQGLVVLDSSVKTYVPAILDDKRSITLRHLLLHTSGLPASLGPDEQYISRETFIAMINRTPLAFQPGTSNQYSDAGYSLLACVVEHVSGLSYEEYLWQKLFAPVGITTMGSTLPNWKKSQIVCGRRDGRAYGSTRDYFGPSGPSWYIVGGGGVLTTVDGLDSFFSALLANRIIDSTATNMIVDHLSRPTKEGQLMFISGSNLIFTSLFSRWRDNDITLILLTSNSAFPKEKVHPVISRLIVEYINNHD